MLTLSALASGVEWTVPGLRLWSRLLVVFTFYSYGIETLQAFRGLDPRFSRAAGSIDQAAGLVFFLVALSIAALFGILAAKYFRAPPSPLVLAVRYGAVASSIAFVTGVWMSLVTQGRMVQEGNLMLAHAVGFHGLQVIPLVALLPQWSGMPQSKVRIMVHVAGITWVGACFGLAWQAASGHATFALAPGTVTASVCLAVFGVTAAIAAWLWFRRGAMNL
jgi:hypothetical protein